MPDFKAAFDAGIAAYDDAERARAEIRGVLNDFFAQVRSASGDHISLKTETKSKQIKKATKTVVRHPPGFPPEFGTAETTMEQPEYKRYRVITASVQQTPNTTQFEELAEVEMAFEGYPVVLVYDDRREDCHDKESLEIGLTRLLEHPGTGGKLKRLMHAKRMAELEAAPAPDAETPAESRNEAPPADQKTE